MKLKNMLILMVIMLLAAGISACEQRSSAGKAIGGAGTLPAELPPEYRQDFTDMFNRLDEVESQISQMRQDTSELAEQIAKDFENGNIVITEPEKPKDELMIVRPSEDMQPGFELPVIDPELIAGKVPGLTQEQKDALEKALEDASKEAMENAGKDPYPGAVPLSAGTNPPGSKCDPITGECAPDPDYVAPDENPHHDKDIRYVDDYDSWKKAKAEEKEKGDDGKQVVAQNVKDEDHKKIVEDAKKDGKVVASIETAEDCHLCPDAAKKFNEDAKENKDDEDTVYVHQEHKTFTDASDSTPTTRVSGPDDSTEEHFDDEHMDPPDVNEAVDKEKKENGME